MTKPMFNLLKGLGGGPSVPRITPAEATAMLTSGGALLVDVREASEVAQSGRLAGARVVPLGALASRADPADLGHDPAFRKDRPVILYCASGNRSSMGGQTLLRLGYRSVYNLGGIGACAAAGMAIERD